MCSMHSISSGQHRFRPTEDLTQPTGLRKGFLEEGTPQLSWDKGKIRGGYSRAREPQGIWFGPRGLQGLGGLSWSPKQLRAGPASGGSYQSQTLQSSVTHKPGQLCQARLCSVILDTLKALPGSCV